MPPKRKLNGSELLAELAGGTLDRALSPATPSEPPPAAPKPAGRRSKVGSDDVVPLTVRVSAETAAALRAAAFQVSAATGGRTTVTAQDVVRMLIDRAIADPGFPADLIGEGQS